ncbi:unnamed protein product [Prorocentrum cordatum]|uniref:Tetratricopeptide repeat protein n=1 Tax=Prorocentrum cordatum TaxID=2364126 RepID=A0ABN9UCL9_9DINO|nr:unnamed protein product [Polarella glacialis]
MQSVLDFGEQIKREGNEAFANENWEGALTRYCQGDEASEDPDLGEILGDEGDPAGLRGARGRARSEKARAARTSGSRP